jgi:TAP-like protein
VRAALEVKNHAAIDEAHSDRPLSSIGVPTLVIHGTADPMFPIEHGRALAREIPGARLLSLEGAGHGIERADWETIGAAIIERTGDDERVKRGRPRSSRPAPPRRCGLRCSPALRPLRAGPQRGGLQRAMYPFRLSPVVGRKLSPDPVVSDPGVPPTTIRSGDPGSPEDRIACDPSRVEPGDQPGLSLALRLRIDGSVEALVLRVPALPESSSVARCSRRVHG